MNTKIKWIGLTRIIGLALVLTYHFFKDYLPGGFIGVDVFFTFSGYLITAQIISEVQRSGNFSASSFYKRRFIRIFPPLFLMVIFILPLSLLISPDFTAGIRKQAAAALGFVTNIYEIKTGGSYEAALLPHLFVHTWTLAVEVHLYILWGFAVKLMLVPFKYKPREFTGAALMLSAELAALSYIYMQLLYASGTGPAAAYFNTLSRAYPFFIGSAAGALFGIRLPKGVKELLSKRRVAVIALAAVILSSAGLFILGRRLTYESWQTYRFGIFAASLLSVVVIIALRTLNESIPARIKEPAPVNALINLSYCIFLFHWPLYIIISNLSFTHSVLTTIGATLVLSIFVFYHIEPLLRRRRKRFVYVDISVIIIASMLLSTYVVIRAPLKTSLEDEIYVGLMYQDYDRIYDVKGIESALTDVPVKLAEMPPIDDLASGISEVSSSVSIVSQTYAEEAVIETAVSTIEIEPSEIDVPVVINEPVIIDEPVVINEPVIIDEPVAASDYIAKGITVIGDSVCLGARRALIETIPDCDVDAAGNRQIWQGHSLMLDLQNAELLGEYVVITLGTNTNGNAFDSIDAIIADLRPGHRLIFVTPYNGNAVPNSITVKTAEYIRTLPAIHPFVTVADWAYIIAPQKELIGADNIHIGGNKPAIALYVNTIMDAINEASRKPASGFDNFDKNEPSDLDIFANL